MMIYGTTHFLVDFLMIYAYLESLDPRQATLHELAQSDGEDFDSLGFYLCTVTITNIQLCPQ